jgi:poly-gamma-glutamate capsule biosynthesis protein CapA/YwtB (metallophosphatase superfamily)
MRRFLCVVITVICAFVFFSFLSHKNLHHEGEITIFFDRDMDSSSLIMSDVKSKIAHLGYKVYALYFNPVEIEHFLITNPSALYVTDKDLHTNLFQLQKHKYTSVRVAVTSHNSDLHSISSDELRGAGATADLQTGSLADVDMLKKLMRHRIPYGVISFQDLSLQVKTLSVDGIFPSLENIRNGTYRHVLHATIYFRKDATVMKNPELERQLGSWQKEAFSIIAGGDIMLSRGVKPYLQKFGVHYPFDDIRTVIQPHDIAFANLESPISNRGRMFHPFKGIYFRTDPSVVEGLHACGFDVLSLANNHALDWGIEAIVDTMSHLEKSGIQYSGIGFSRKEALVPAVFTVSGARVAFLCYNDIYPLFYTESGRTVRTLSLKLGELKQEIDSLKQIYDVIVVSVHTGTEYLLEPEKEKIKKMRALVDAGVQVVLGSHPHVVQGIELYRGGLIAYSLGNLIFDQNWSTETSLGLLLEIGFLRKRPIYYKPSVVSIERSRAHIVDDVNAASIFSYIHRKKDVSEYVKN